MEQTAVNWLFEQVNNLDWRNLQGDKKLEIFEQAKAMEKEQIIDAQMDMFNNTNKIKFGLDYLNKRDAAEEYAEQYYKETYTND